MTKQIIIKTVENHALPGDWDDFDVVTFETAGNPSRAEIAAALLASGAIHINLSIDGHTGKFLDFNCIAYPGLRIDVPENQLARI